MITSRSVVIGIMLGLILLWARSDGCKEYRNPGYMLCKPELRGIGSQDNPRFAIKIIERNYHGCSDKWSWMDKMIATNGVWAIRSFDNEED